MKNTLFLSIGALIIASFLFSQFSKTPKKLEQQNKATIAKITEKNQEVKTNFSLEVNSPKDRAIVSTPIIKVEGKTIADAEVFVNEKETKSDPTGSFSVEYELFEGENEIYVSANNSNGNYAEKVITVYLETTE